MSILRGLHQMNTADLSGLSARISAKAKEIDALEKRAKGINALMGSGQSPPAVQALLEELEQSQLRSLS